MRARSKTFRNDAKFMAVINDSVFSPDDKMKNYVKILKQYKFKLANRSDLQKVEMFKKLLEDSKEQLLDVFIESLSDLGNSQGVFNFADE